MAIADLILVQICAIGLRTEVLPRHAATSDAFTVRATDPVTGTSWTASGITLTDAAAELAAKIGLTTHAIPEESPILTAPAFPPAPHDVVPPTFSPQPADFPWHFMPLVVGLTGIIFLLDLLCPGVNLGIFYVGPLVVAFQSKVRTRSLFALAALMALLILIDEVAAEQSFPSVVHHEPGGILNRTFGIATVIACAFIMALFYQRKTARRPSSPRFTLSPMDRAVAWFAALFILVTFVTDLLTPAPLNVPIFYLLPLIIYSALHRRFMWSVVGVLVALLTLGYLLSPHAGITAIDAHLILTNRIVCALSLACIALLIHLTTRTLPASRRQFDPHSDLP